jgi:hypothetical protein
METKMTIRELLAKRETLQKLLSMDLPIRISYRLSKLVSEVNKQYDFFANSNQELVKRFGKDDGNGTFRVDTKNEKVFAEFTAELETLLKEEVILTFTPVKLEELGEEIKLTPLEVSILIGSVIDDGEEVEKVVKK